MLVEEVAFELAKLQYQNELLEKENSKLKAHNDYQDSLIQRLNMNEHDSQILENIKLRVKNGNVNVRELEWMIVTLDYYLNPTVKKRRKCHVNSDSL